MKKGEGLRLVMRRVGLLGKLRNVARSWGETMGDNLSLVRDSYRIARREKRKAPL